MSAIGDQPLEPMMPALRAMFAKEGWLILLWGLLLLPIGFAIQAAALIQTRALPRWQSIGFRIGVLVIGFPDGAEIISVSAAILLAVVCLPYGLRMLRPASSPGAVLPDAGEPPCSRTPA